MKAPIAALTLLAILASAAPLRAQDGAAQPANRAPRRAPVGIVQGPSYHTEYVKLGQRGEGLLYEPNTLGPKSRIALVYTHPSGNNLSFVTGPELASRGYRVININYRGNTIYDVTLQLPTYSLAVGFMRSLPGVQRVIVLGHSGGTQAMSLYDNVAEHGPAACDGPEKIYPCQAEGLDGLQKPDGVILLDPPLGTFHEASGIDPAVTTDVHVRNPALDMWTAANGYDAAHKRAHYSAAFAKRFYAAQSARNDQIVDAAVARLHAIEQGKGKFSNDEPWVVVGLGEDANGARLFQPDPSFAAHTKAPHLVLKADGTRAMEIVRSVREPAANSAAGLERLNFTSTNTNLRDYLAHSAIRLTKDYAITADDITGVDWNSAVDSVPGNASGVTVPTLVMAMGCHYLMVPAEIVYDRLPAKDKTYAAVEGAVHGFTPCKPEYGDTQKRVFDYVDEWLSKDGRF